MTQHWKLWSALIVTSLVVITLLSANAFTNILAAKVPKKI